MGHFSKYYCLFDNVLIVKLKKNLVLKMKNDVLEE